MEKFTLSINCFVSRLNDTEKITINKKKYLLVPIDQINVFENQEGEVKFTLNSELCDLNEKEVFCLYLKNKITNLSEQIKVATVKLFKK